MEMFIESLELCSLNKLRIGSPIFTWSNNRTGTNHTKEILDSALGNPTWLQMFRDASCMVIPVVKSDHSPLKICLDCKWKIGNSNVRIFRFEAAWNLKEGCDHSIKEGWRMDAPGVSQTERMSRRLGNCSSALRRWNSTENRKTPNEIKDKMKRLGELQEMGSGENEIETTLAEEDLKWKQRAKQHWMKMGDKNTKFYHLHATQRRNTNIIQEILDCRGNLVTGKQQIGSILSSFFIELFTSSRPMWNRRMPRKLASESHS
ncbi:uncharacterized protein LOC122289520 [Carya illinoinensis]|uniref:uncharacterized protein LOC122289520 n=1 Tax=Carya illinoinensis TaxID=32201 RepID=UPI001C71CEE3|nr:uncharacterized protein LOC122289520 [Carya illinoinensis]